MPEFSINLIRTLEDPSRYSLVVSDNDEHTISGTFSIQQLQILKSIMLEAETFALNQEASGTTEPITTRFLDKQESAFVIDVEKLGGESRLHLTISTELGRLTLECGRVNRSVRREVGVFFDLLARLEAELPKSTTKPK